MYRKSTEFETRRTRRLAVRQSPGLVGATMLDIVFVAVTVAFFVFSMGYVHFCDRVK